MKRKKKRPEYRPSWSVLLLEKLNKLQFPSLVKGKLTPGKRLAGLLRLLRHGDSDFPRAGMSEREINAWIARAFVAKDVSKLNAIAEMGLHLERAVVSNDRQFLADFRKASVDWLTLSKWQDVFSWMLTHHREVEACRTAAQIWHLVADRFHLRSDERSNFCRTLREVGLSRTAKKVRR